MRPFCLAAFFLALVLLASGSIAAAPPARPNGGSFGRSYMVVDQSGVGDFAKIQDAIDSVPSNNNESVLIQVNPGTYSEQVVVPPDKPFITLKGKHPRSTVITSDEGWNMGKPSTLSVLASDFVGRSLTIQNTFGRGGPAIALTVSGDRVAFYRCRILSYQDTLLDSSGRHYYRKCYIEGATDFICGNGRSLFERCHLHSISKHGGAITAQSRNSEADDTGYSFVRCNVTGHGPGTEILGRPWGPYSRVVFAFTHMSHAVAPRGWDDWGLPDRQRTAFFGQYDCSGPGSSSAKRVPWARQLSESEASGFVTVSWIDGQEWLKPRPTY